MCLGIPMKVVRIDGDDGVVETGGLRRKANLSLIKGLKAGDYVILHAGFAIEKLKTGEAKKTLKLLRSI
ncbi:MAG: HypC/HybG/HupF family hydrogenase formation chaperone [Candidatus Omnitrophota bacterium]